MDLLKYAPLLLIVACKPDLGARASLVQGARVLAIRAEPAEAKEKEPVTFTMLVVDTMGTMSAPPIDWGYCTLRKPLSDLEPVTSQCLTASADFIVPIGNGASATGEVPTQACRNFGPETPQPKPGDPFGRPTDPDPTGGYYQPLRALVLGLASVGVVRVACGIAGAAPDQIQDFNRRYRLNKNPEIETLTIAGTQPAMAPVPVASGSKSELKITWAACPDGDPAECTGAERYLVYDVAAEQNFVRRESMRASWFVTDGQVDADRTGRAEDDAANDTSTTYTAPSKPALVHAWVVLRDDRGGVTWRSFDLDVR